MSRREFESAAYAELTAAYARAADTQDGWGITEVFAPDGILDLRNFGYPDALRGRPAIGGHFDVSWKRIASSLHLVSNHLVRVAHGTLGGTCAFMSVTWMNSGSRVHVLGTYDDLVEHIDDRWVFTNRTLHQLGVWEEVGNEVGSVATAIRGTIATIEQGA